MADVLVNHPYFGSLWLSDCYIKDGYIIGETWDDGEVGSPYFPDDYRGQPVTMNFPVSCIRKDPNGLTQAVGLTKEYYD